MPNWVTNNVIFKGDKKVIEKMLKEIRGEREDQAIDFNKIAPIPKELEGTRSPTLIISQEEYDQQEERLAKGELTEGEERFGVSRGLTQALADKYRAEFGHSDWYGWQIANWGTKWNACDIFEFDNGIEFNTAWSTPFELLLTLSRIYPEITINVRYADEDFGYNVGEYTLRGGDEIDENVPNGGSREALELAMDIQYGGDYPFDDYEIFTDLYSDEMNDYMKSMIDIAYDRGYYPFEDCGYHKLVLERFKEKALADENFELVAIIQKELEKVEEEE